MHTGCNTLRCLPLPIATYLLEDRVSRRLHLGRVIGFDKCGACCLRKQKAGNDKKLNMKPEKKRKGKNWKRDERKHDIRVRTRPANRDKRRTKKRGTRVRSCTNDNMNMSFSRDRATRVHTCARFACGPAGGDADLARPFACVVRVRVCACVIFWGTLVGLV